MDKKPKYDLSNVGGKPKDWLDRASAPSSGGWPVFLAILAVVVIVLGVADFALALFQFKL